MKPYYYRIKHTLTGQRYIGCQYGKNASKDDFFTTYFTSSKKVKELIQKYGLASFIIEKIVEMDNARSFENRVLKRLYTSKGHDNFILEFLNRNTAPGILLDEETIKKIQSNPIRAKKIQDAKFGNTNVKGYHWWNNGEKMIRSKDKPGDDWVIGALSPTQETRQKMSKCRIGKKQKEESKIKCSIARNNPNHKGNHKGTIWVINENGDRKRVFPSEIPSGFKPVKDIK